MARIRLVTRGDDAGSCRAANRAVAVCARSGVVRNASVMAPAPFLEDAARRLRGIAGLGIGLHLTLTSEWDAPTWGPCAPRERVPDLIDARGALPRDAHALAERTDRIDQMLIEAEAQWVRLQSVGLEPDYLDEHMGVADVVPGLRAALDDWAGARGLRLAHATPNLPGSGSLIERLASAEPGAWVWVNHPGFDGPEMRGLGNASYPGAQVAAERARDRREWLDPALRDAAVRYGVEWVRYSDL